MEQYEPMDMRVVGMPSLKREDYLDYLILSTRFNTPSVEEIKVHLTEIRKILGIRKNKKLIF